MPMSIPVLANLISTQMSAVEQAYKNGEKPPADAHTALATAIITHLLTSAEVNLSTGKIT